MQKYYDEHKAEFVRQETVSVREILISTGDNSPAKVAAAEKKAKDIVDRARKNEKIVYLARQHSDAETAKEDRMLGTSITVQPAPGRQSHVSRCPRLGDYAGVRAQWGRPGGLRGVEERDSEPAFRAEGAAQTA